MTERATDWRAAIFNRRMLICVFTGFASGLPFFVLIQLLPAWLKEEGVSLAEIGLFALPLADIIDVGGESTRPGAAAVWEGDELKRVIPAIERLSASGAAISIDGGWTAK